jgi:hypothetical protein
MRVGLVLLIAVHRHQDVAFIHRTIMLSEPNDYKGRMLLKFSSESHPWRDEAMSLTVNE